MDKAVSHSAEEQGCYQMWEGYREALLAQGRLWASSV